MRKKEAKPVPYKPKRGCAYPGCPDPAEPGGQYCEKYKSIVNRQYDRFTRDNKNRKKYENNWKRIRDSYAKAHPFCEMCLANGIYTKMDEVHHQVPVSRGGRNQWCCLAPDLRKNDTL